VVPPKCIRRKGDEGRKRRIRTVVNMTGFGTPSVISVVICMGLK
jgi:hypothetical protein